MAENTSPAEKKTSRRRVLWRVCGYIFEHKWLMLTAFAVMLVANLIALVAPYYSGLVINAIEPGRGSVDFETVGYYCTLLVVIYVVSAAFTYLLSFIMVRISQRIGARMRRQVFDHLTNLPVSYFDSHQTGDIISHISYDIDTVNASLSNDLLQIATSVITVVGSLAMMLSISPILSLVFAVTVPISLVFAKYRTQKVRPMFRKRSKKLGELNGYAEEMLSGQRTIKAYSIENIIVDRFDGHNEDACDAYYRADYHGSVIGPTMIFINNLSLTLITALGGLFYLFSITDPNLPLILVIDLGMVSAFVQYSRKFFGPINEFANILSEIQSATSAAERVFALLDEPTEPADRGDAVVLSDAEGDIKMEDVRFGYTETKEILHGVNIHAERGKTIAIVGPTGSGKTTVINLLMRFYDHDSGKIMFDGKELSSLTRDSLRSAYTMVLQDTWLFCGTVFDNITYGTDGATKEDVIRAAKAARIHDFIMTLPEGYNTVLSDDGVNISKGQKQLITIARAMLSRAPVLILDEATSNVDSRTEKLIQDALYALMEGRTCIVIAHRLSTIQNADRILVVRDGCIEEQGTHNELLDKGGFYASLYNAQFK
ncbi:MAG: ABC transporter ATP-binding protein [Clostridia bacterium]|nr:ABC transporter ATP-binding protein [Clostridia bacterium]